MGLRSAAYLMVQWYASEEETTLAGSQMRRQQRYWMQGYRVRTYTAVPHASRRVGCTLSAARHGAASASSAWPCAGLLGALDADGGGGRGLAADEGGVDE
jgi:hypothetical protein